MPAPVIAIESVCLSFTSRERQVTVLRDINLQVGGGESVALVGPSGSGKSSLLMLAAGLERPSSGSVTLLGHDLGPLNEDALALLRRDHVGIVFQSFHLIPTMTALENVALPLDLAGSKDALPRAHQELAEVGLGERAQHYPGELSGGEQQRVAIARAVIAAPDLLLADEPTGNLDRDTGARIASLLFGTAARRKAALVIVTHDPELAARADRVLGLSDGQLAEGKQGAPLA